MENMELSRAEIKARIKEREAQGKPTRKLREALSRKNRAWNVTKSSNEIEREIAERKAAGKPTRHLEDELRSRR
jgi:hypothetical protein